MTGISRFPEVVAIALATSVGLGFQQAATASAAAVGPATETVRVAGSIEARDALDRIAALESQGRFVQAGRDYQRLLANYGNAVVRMPDGSHTGVTPLVLLRIKGWPEDAKAIHRDLLEPQAAAALQAIDASADASQVMIQAQRWWLTRSAGQAALQSARRLAECGYTRSAEWVVERLAQGHPELAGEIQQLRQLCVKRTGTAGSPLQSLQTASRPETQSAPKEAVLWSIDLAKAQPASDDAPHGESPEIAEGKMMPPSMPAEPDRPVAGPAQVSEQTLSRPVILGDHVFAQDASRLYCLRLYSGHIEWATALKPAGKPVFDPTAGEGCVFAVLPDAKASPAATQPARIEHVLIGFAASNGSRVWAARPRELLDMEGEGGTVLRSSPVWYEGGLYVVAGTRTGLIEDLYLLRVDPETGRTAWRRHLASWTTVDAGVPGTACTLSAAGGMIHVAAPCGLEATVAALTSDVERIAPVPNAGAPRSMPAGKESTVETGGVIVHVGQKGTPSSATISVTASEGNATPLLERRISEDPRDCARRLDLVRWATGRSETANRAIAVMRDALTCAESMQPAAGKETSQRATTARTGEQSRRVRRQVLELAMENAGIAGISDELLAIGAQACESPEDHARHRLRFSASRASLGRWSAAIALLQDILEDDVIRAQRIDGRAAGAIATETIAAIIGKKGRLEYEVFEKRAEALAAAESGDPGKLEAVLLRFPNSRVASRARFELARIARRSDRPRQAIRWLTEGTALVNEEDRALAAAQVAECYFEMGDATRGLATLTSGARAFENRPITFAGSQTTFGQARVNWLANANTISRPLPKVAEPIGPAAEHTLEQPFLLLTGPNADNGPVVRRFDLGLVLTGRTIQAIDASSKAIRWQAAWETLPAPVWTADDDDVLLLTTPTRVLALDRETGRERWRWDLSNDDRDNAALIDPEFLDTLTAQAVHDTMVVVASRSGILRAMRLSDGQLMWQQRIAGTGIDAIGFGDQEVCCLRVKDGRPEAIVLDAEDGRELARAALEHDSRPMNPVLAADGTIVIADGRVAVGYEPRTLRPSWRWPVPENATATGLRAIGGKVYVYGTGFVASLAPDGRLGWQVTDAGSAGAAVRSVRAAGGQLYIAGDDYLASADAANGTIRRRIALNRGETIEDWTLTTRHVAVIISRAADGEATGPRALEVVFMPRAAKETGRAPTEPRVLLSSSIPLGALVLRDGAILAHAGEKLVSWQSPAGTSTIPASR